MPEPPSFPETITLVRDRVRKIIGRVSVPSEMADVRSWPHNRLKSDMAPRPFCAMNRHGEREKPPEMAGFSASASQTIIVDKIV
jgi:hypothetical protein